ncbi:MAG TPA: DUF6069 family protein [Acidimicrobiales bacterium]|nr:DUF6069 family protein [Acidimicrobiales bacterium]
MSTITTTEPTFIASASAVPAAPRSLLRVGVAAGVLGAAAATLVAVVAKAAGVPMMAADKASAVADDLPMYGFAMGVLISTAVGIVLAAGLGRWVKRGAGVFVGVTVALTIVSFFGPVTTHHATTATRLVLALTHVVAAAIVIPPVAGWVAQRSARSS